VTPRKSLGDIPAAMISRSSSSPIKMCLGRAVSSGGFHCPSREASSAKMYQYRIEFATVSGYTPSRYSRTLSVENRTASPHAEWTDESGEGRKPDRMSGSPIRMSLIRAIPRGASKDAGPWRGPASGQWNPRSRKRRPAKADFQAASGVSGYTSGNSRTKSWSYCSDQDTPKPMRLSQKRTRSMCNYSTGC
jgi:hypothetical protein